MTIQKAIVPHRLQSTAYHEAAHAVAYWNFNLRFRYVTIQPKGESLGHISVKHPAWFYRETEMRLTDRCLLYAERDIIASLAGQIAQKKFLGKRPRYGFHSDNQWAVELAFKARGGSQKTVEAYLHYCWNASTDLVDRCWREIEALASALIERQKLLGCFRSNQPRN